MSELNRILLVEDSPHDVELILAALSENALAGEVYVVKPIDFCEFVKVIKQAGLLWAVVNQPPPYSTA